MKIAQVYINQLNIHLDRLFDYLVPKHLESQVIPGSRVVVPFGFGNKSIDALVWDLKSPPSDSSKLKSILGVVEHFPVLDHQQLKTCRFLQQVHHSLFMDVANAFYPGPIQIRKHKDSNGVLRYYVGQKDRESWLWKISQRNPNQTLEQLLSTVRSNATVQREILTLLWESPIEEAVLTARFRGVKKTLESLRSAGFLEKHRMKSMELEDPGPLEVQGAPRLTEAQQQILEDFEKGFQQTHLIHGVTGSGKTEVYLHMMEAALKKDKTCLYLVPEISLTPQTIHRVKARFGQEIAVIHSRISDGERLEQYKKIATKEIRIIVGARSAILSPFQDLGLIVIDEEHENTYKSSNRPRFDTVSLAQEIARLHGAKVVLGSATPSIGTYYLAKNGQYGFHRLPDRMNGQDMPASLVVDMRVELQSGNRSFLSRTLYASMREALKRKEQIILFLNKRGYFSYVFCRDCGYVVKCKQCDVTMTYHGEDNRLECHYCKATAPVQHQCPACGSRKMKYSGTGTERMQNMLQKYFPHATVLRMDTDSMKKKDAIADAVEDFTLGKADILLGTQMVTKGFDFENVTLVGVLLADLTLNFPDYRSSERTFQLITQVAGRAGRGNKKGNVVIQTYEPDHYAITHAQQHDYEGFYEKEVAYRKMNRYPPFSTLMYIGFSGNDEKEVAKECSEYHRLLSAEVTKTDPSLVFEAYPPSKSNIVRVNNKYRYYILIKTEHVDAFQEAIHHVQRSKETKQFKSTIFVDVNPNFIF
ncbi:primosomal protein N' [Alkalibacter rhizosphaerae]|uniref:Replication restart protein PriA n=1 Tax=Alkalibacter rhizosphaerae TaxID=2815577 RepID=A0A975AHL5_9FIRM|nr:primosomal protein N' [Alkalibacter rhizosphaerae]QSX08749.1 primosomal protein N' [Alkalibacter rhizosphaerae]